MENPSPNTIRFPWPQPVAIPTHSHTISINKDKTYEIAERIDIASSRSSKNFFRSIAYYRVGIPTTTNHILQHKSNLLFTSYMTYARNVPFCITPTGVASRRAWSMACVLTESKHCAWLFCHLWTPLCIPMFHTTVTHTALPRMIWYFHHPVRLSTPVSTDRTEILL